MISTIFIVGRWAHVFWSPRLRLSLYAYTPQAPISVVTPVKRDYELLHCFLLLLCKCNRSVLPTSEKPSHVRIQDLLQWGMFVGRRFTNTPTPKTGSPAIGSVGSQYKYIIFSQDFFPEIHFEMEQGRETLRRSSRNWGGRNLGVSSFSRWVRP